MICNAGRLGLSIPPSPVRVVYAALAEVLVDRHFMAGVLPGILLGLMLRVAVSMGGIHGGIFTPTEAAAASAVHALFVALFTDRDLKFTDMPEVFLESTKTTVLLMFSIAHTLLQAHDLTTQRIPQTIGGHIMAVGLSPWMFLLVVTLLRLIAGNFMKLAATMLILAPILFPFASHLGSDPVHLGLLLLLTHGRVTGMRRVQVTRAALLWRRCCWSCRSSSPVDRRSPGMAQRRLRPLTGQDTGACEARARLHRAGLFIALTRPRQSPHPLARSAASSR